MRRAGLHNRDMGGQSARIQTICRAVLQGCLCLLALRQCSDRRACDDRRVCAAEVILGTVGYADSQMSLCARGDLKSGHG